MKALFCVRIKDENYIPSHYVKGLVYKIIEERKKDYVGIPKTSDGSIVIYHTLPKNICIKIKANEDELIITGEEEIVIQGYKIDIEK